jgi:hypothetical protein
VQVPKPSVPAVPLPPLPGLDVPKVLPGAGRDGSGADPQAQQQLLDYLLKP